MPLKVLLGHNTYQWPGGEDVAMGLDAQLLEGRGHSVVRYVRDNDEIAAYGRLDKARFAASAVWSKRARREVGELVARHRPQVAHFHNTFPLISPSAFAACHDAGVPVVVTIQTYRLACANAFLFRDGRVCEDCLHRVLKWPAVVHRCYHDSALQSAVVAGMLAAHRSIGAWSRLVDVFVAVSEFGRAKLVEAGLPAERVLVRPNFAEPDPGDRPPGRDDGYALFVGRLSPEKGVAVMLDAVAALPYVPLRVAGDGPLRADLEGQGRRSRTHPVPRSAGPPGGVRVDARGAGVALPVALVRAFPVRHPRSVRHRAAGDLQRSRRHGGDRRRPGPRSHLPARGRRRADRARAVGVGSSGRAGGHGARRPPHV